MRPSSIIWGGGMVLLGGLLLLSNLGLITVDVWGLFWPVVMIMGGLWLLLGVFFPRTAKVEAHVIPLDGARQARVRVAHAAGRLIFKGGADPANLAQGDFGGGLDLQRSVVGDTLEAKLSVPGRTAWKLGPMSFRAGELDWNVAFNSETPMALRLETGAGELLLDFSSLRLNELELYTGASSTDIVLPTNAGYTRVKIEAGAASIKLHVPQGVAGRIRSSSGLANISINRERFAYAGGVYQSPDFDSAANRVEISIEVGAASVEVR